MGYVYILITIILTVTGQLLVKWRMSLKGVLPESAVEKVFFLIKSLIFDPWLLSGFMGAFLAALAWMAAMTKMDLGHAYPFMSITFPAVVILSGVFFHETISVYQYIGLFLIVSGVIVGSKG